MFRNSQVYFGRFREFPEISGKLKKYSGICQKSFAKVGRLFRHIEKNHATKVENAALTKDSKSPGSSKAVNDNRKEESKTEIVESKEDVNDRNNNSTTVSDVKCEPLVNDNQIFQNDDVYDSGNLVIDSEPEFGKEIKNEVKFDSPKGLLDDGMNVTSKSELELKKVDDFSLKQEQLEVNFKTFEGLRHQLEDQSLYSCDLCGREFPWKTSLRRHINSVHEKKKPHKCSICDFSSFKKWN